LWEKGWKGFFLGCGSFDNWNSSNISDGMIWMLNISLFHCKKIHLIFPLSTMNSTNICISSIALVTLINFFYRIGSNSIIILPSSIFFILPEMIVFGVLSNYFGISFCCLLSPFGNRFFLLLFCCCFFCNSFLWFFFFGLGFLWFPYFLLCLFFLCSGGCRSFSFWRCRTRS